MKKKSNLIRFIPYFKKYKKKYDDIGQKSIDFLLKFWYT